MKVIKVVDEREGKLVSTFALGEWQKEYAKGVETKPDTGYLFAYPRRDMKRARSEMGGWHLYQFWLAEAEVVGEISDNSIDVNSDTWHDFWNVFRRGFRPQPTVPYLLCSSVTLIKILA